VAHSVEPPALFFCVASCASAIPTSPKAEHPGVENVEMQSDSLPVTILMTSRFRRNVDCGSLRLYFGTLANSITSISISASSSHWKTSNIDNKHR
jgi:hypothetical protein